MGTSRRGCLPGSTSSTTTIVMQPIRSPGIWTWKPSSRRQHGRGQNGTTRPNTPSKERPPNTHLSGVRSSRDRSRVCWNCSRKQSRAKRESDPIGNVPRRSSRRRAIGGEVNRKGGAGVSLLVGSLGRRRHLFLGHEVLRGAVVHIPGTDRDFQHRRETAGRRLQQACFDGCGFLAGDTPNATPVGSGSRLPGARKSSTLGTRVSRASCCLCRMGGGLPRIAATREGEADEAGVRLSAWSSAGMWWWSCRWECGGRRTAEGLWRSSLTPGDFLGEESGLSPNLSLCNADLTVLVACSQCPAASNPEEDLCRATAE